METKAYLGLGTNLGDRGKNLSDAIGLLKRSMAIDRTSSIYETEPVGYLEQPWFLNLVCCARTSLDPEGLLCFIKAIEQEMGRVRSFPNAPRPIDIDILLFGQAVVESPDLIVPHPRLTERAFVLIPLAEIEPDLAHPIFKKSMATLLLELTDSSKVRKLRNVSSIC